MWIQRARSASRIGWSPVMSQSATPDQDVTAGSGPGRGEVRVTASGEEIVFEPRDPDAQRDEFRRASAYGRLRKSTRSTTLKTAVVAPMPTAVNAIDSDGETGLATVIADGIAHILAEVFQPVHAAGRAALVFDVSTPPNSRNAAWRAPPRRHPGRDVLLSLPVDVELQLLVQLPGGLLFADDHSQPLEPVHAIRLLRRHANEAGDRFRQPLPVGLFGFADVCGPLRVSE